MKDKITKWLVCLTLGAASLLFFLSFISFRREDFFLFSYPPTHPSQNFIGIFGVYFAGTLLFSFGWASWMIFILLVFLLFKQLDKIHAEGIASSAWTKTLSFLIILISASLLLGIFDTPENRFSRSGIIGFSLSALLLQYIGFLGSLILSVLLFVAGLLLFWGDFVVECAKKIFVNLRDYFKRERVVVREKEHGTIQSEMAPKVPRKAKLKIYTPSNPDPGITEDEPEKPPQEITRLIVREKPKEKEVAPAKAASLVSKESEEKPNETPQIPYNDAAYVIPACSILKDVSQVTDEKKVKGDIEVNAAVLEETLSDFGVSARVVSVQSGPVITRYELQPAAGVKINSIVTLSDDIALAMKAASVRIVAPIPGKGTVGVEVPNSQTNIVYVKEVVQDKRFIQSPSKLSLALGKDVAGVPLIADLKDMPHLLIAGTTGSGKTVCVNSIICSILFKSKPSDARFILIDPKMVELAQFVGIPHLLSPIVSDAKKASNVLSWATEEMERRYSLLAEEGARNIDSYNMKKPEVKLPFIVIVVDELADLMIIARDQIETAILRLAQLSRAVGIHLILATQRPSVDVITGVIKANFPARISFKVASKVDSRTVLDWVGAEKLLGKGDMLFIRPGILKPIRAQACLIEDDDVTTLINAIRSQGQPQYDSKILEVQRRPKAEIEADELLPEAIRTVMETGQASASIIQRRLRVGYTRAARLLDLMEQEGIVGPFQGSKARQILIDREQWFQEQQKIAQPQENELT